MRQHCDEQEKQEPGSVSFHGVFETPNDPISATRRTGRNDCNHNAPAGFAGAHGYASIS